MATTLAFLGGIIPPIIWLWFWLKEDSAHPEPKRYILATFFTGMITAAFVIFIEQVIIENTIKYGLLSLLLLSGTEEISKFIFAYGVVLRKKVVNEPVDAVIYMITIALGFAAAENFLYLLEVFSNGINLQGIVMTNMRFIGATVLHTTSSAIIGVAIALSFYKKRFIKRIYLFIGLILSIALHTSFNFFIIKSNGGSIFQIFVIIWIIVILLLLLFEKIKRIRKPIIN